jgi:hypothetical protein
MVTKPFTSGVLFNLLRAVMLPDVAGNLPLGHRPLDCLDTAQIILLRNGHAVKWIWGICEDFRIANSECVVFMVCHASAT